MSNPGIKAGFNADGREWLLPVEKLPFWDISDFPTTNARFSKVGSSTALMGAVIGAFDEKTGRRKHIDGRQEPEGSGRTWSDVIGTQQVEPDNFALRLHQVGGKQSLSTWAIRLIADNTNRDGAIENRGTMIIDQENDQRWGWLNDLLMVSGREQSVDQDEISFNGAGFLDMLYPDEHLTGGTFVHNQMALKIHLNQGLVTDGVFLGQLMHVMGFQGSSKGDQASGSGSGDSSRAGGGGRPAAEENLYLLAHAGYLWPDKKIRSLPVIENAPDKTDDNGDSRVVHFYEGTKLGDSTHVASDGNSNFDLIKKKGWPAIAGYVKVPAPEQVPEKTPPTGTTPISPSEPSTYTPMPTGKSQSAPIKQDVMKFNAGELQGFAMNIHLPQNVGPDTYVEVDYPIAVGSAYGKGQSSIIDIGTVTMKQCQAGGPPTPTWTPKSLSSADGLHTDNYRILRQTIPSADIQGKDIVPVYCFMRSTSTGPPVLMENPRYRCKIGSNTGGVVII